LSYFNQQQEHFIWDLDYYNIYFFHCTDRQTNRGIDKQTNRRANIFIKSPTTPMSSQEKIRKEGK